MDQAAIALWLTQTFADQQLDSREKQALRASAETLTPELRKFARNRAFELVRTAITSGQADPLAALRWLEHTVKGLDTSEAAATVSAAHFSPGSACRNAILDCLQQASRTVDICVFTLSDDRISNAILKTHERGVVVRVISDNDKANDEGSDIDLLQRNGVPVRIDQTIYHMHHKFALFDKRVLLNGSFNWTRSASQQNEENITVSSDASLVKAFSHQFEMMWERYI